MKILVVGGGGREHAICWKLSNEKNVEKIYCAPGNPGIAEVAECVNIGNSDIDELAKFAKENEIDITVVGPEVPLVMGITDVFESQGLKVFGPNKKCARLEGSKAFSKDFMTRHNLPTAKYKEYTNIDKAIDDIYDFGYPVVIKADGLAAGKGVIISENREDAIKTLKEMMNDKKFGTAGEKIVIEEFLSGIETSILAFVDNETIIPMVSAKDHKKVNDGETGLNTGGMGTFSPSEIYTYELSKEIKENILDKTLKGFQEDNLDFRILLVGSGNKTQEYKKMVNEYKLENNIIFLGKKQNPYPYFKLADSLILTSEYEGFPVVYLEAMILNIPIITTNVSDSLQIIQNKHGVVTQKNVNSIYNAMKNAIINGISQKEEFDYKEYNQEINEKLEKLINA